MAKRDKMLESINGELTDRNVILNSEIKNLKKELAKYKESVIEDSYDQGKMDNKEFD
jgi:hypothetical protein